MAAAAAARQEELKTTTKAAHKKTPVTDALLYINSEITRKQYHRRLELFFDYIGLEGEDLDAQGQAFLDQARNGQDPE
ncbi:MAG TPA: hypothetical protein VHJ59_07720 [Nitrososphaera sp.]|jgi:hypothetical protein|nr:hypothetical protein [Nitrososphaera sp.]